MIAVIDYKAGNLTSVVKALRHLGADDILVTQEPSDVLRARKIVLPGVGHFRSTQLLHDLGLTDAVRAATANGTPFLGICVGLQWLYEGSTEAPETAGLGHFAGRCERFPASHDGADLKSPHVGWNSLENIRPDSKLLAGVTAGSLSMIAVIDYKAGNLTSVVKALRHLGADDILVTQEPSDVLRARKIVLPGVGHFRSTQLLHDLGLTDAVRAATANGTPFLGICVGLQWLYEGSTEAPETAGFGHFAGQCERFPASHDGADLKSPHVGWNSLENIRPDSKLLAGVTAGSFVYYTHSWRAPISSDTAAATPYGGDFTGAVERGNVMGVQFHPEKSAETGLRVLNNFLLL